MRSSACSRNSIHFIKSFLHSGAYSVGSPFYRVCWCLERIFFLWAVLLVVPAAVPEVASGIFPADRTKRASAVASKNARGSSCARPPRRPFTLWKGFLYRVEVRRKSSRPRAIAVIPLRRAPTHLLCAPKVVLTDLPALQLRGRFISHVRPVRIGGTLDAHRWPHPESVIEEIQRHVLAPVPRGFATSPLPWAPCGAGN